MRQDRLKRSRIRSMNSGICFLLMLCFALNTQARTPSAEEMWRVIQEQQRVIDSLQEKLKATQSQVQETAAGLEATADVVENSSWQRTRRRSTTVGGYGELHYNNLNDDAGSDNGLDRTDFHRFVLFFGHEFNDRIRFFSELEAEHSLTGGGGPGEVELEQAWVEMDINTRHRLRAGLDILPIGILNPTHEPDTFYGVERNRIESEIIPATWWEAGASAYGELAPGWSYDLVAHSGLAVPITGDNPFRPRSGRLKVAEADDQDIAFTGRLRYTGYPGLEIAVAGQYQADITGTADAADISATLFETHIDWKHSSGFGLRALYARWDIGDDNGIDPAKVNADTLDGWYVEPAYRFQLLTDYLGELGVFARYSQWDERNRLGPPDFRFEEFNQLLLGFNWWPHANLAFKLDVQWQDADGPVDRVLDGFNLGFGYQF